MSKALKQMAEIPPSANFDALDSARRTLALEVRGLEEIIRHLDHQFAAAIAKLAVVKGRVIISGMGKSGHVGAKIAATLASTGTPAQFVHPAEASHGDLGMITKDDAVIALSNSGETPELADLIAHAKRFGIALIAITRKANSTLAKAADIPLILPESVEACSLQLAPTTSTTQMLALGDALAIALLEKKGFSADDFRQLHPGGKLGRTLQRVADLMHQGDEIPLIAGAAPVSEALLEMTSKRFGCVGVVGQKGELLGIITDGDLRRHMQNDLVKQLAEKIMTANPKTIRPHALAAEALGLMNEKSITCLFVTENDKPAGIIHIHDLLRAGIA
ncbi:MAG: SIS domain-containing protein [Dongiaceae bacterium]